MTETPYSWSYRVSRALLAVALNVVLWIVVPSFLLGQLEQSLPSSSAVTSTSFIYAFGITITGLQVIGALTAGMAVSVPFLSGSYLAEAYYIWTAASGGLRSVAAEGFGVSVSFQPLLFLLVLAPLFNAVKAPIGYLLDLSEVSRPSPDVV